MTVKERRRVQAPLPRKVTITVGIHAAEGDEVKDGATFADDGALVPNTDLTVADVAQFHEFGTSIIPARSFIRGWFDERQEFIRDTLRKQMAAVIAGKRPVEQGAERIALAFEGDVKQRISRGIPPPLAQSTIDRKGSSKQLIDTGQLRNAVRGKADIG